MSQLAYARKYRPNTFDEIIDQHHIATARILAKALNCAKGPTVNPCDTCPACVEIREGRSLDVLEIDGASNRGIDEIRTRQRPL